MSRLGERVLTVSLVSWKSIYSQLCVDGLLLHDIHDGPAGVGRTFRRGVNRDGLLCRACVFFPVDVDPEARQQHLLITNPLRQGNKWSKHIRPFLHAVTQQTRPIKSLNEAKDQRLAPDF